MQLAFIWIHFVQMDVLLINSLAFKSNQVWKMLTMFIVKTNLFLITIISKYLPLFLIIVKSMVIPISLLLLIYNKDPSLLSHSLKQIILYLTILLCSSNLKVSPSSMLITFSLSHFLIISSKMIIISKTK
jgi:hypothetical protein